MEALYSKLYDKYTKLKAQKGSALDKLNYDQEEKFRNYVNAADELIQHLTSEIDGLRAEVSKLGHEIDSIRSTKDEQEVEYQNLLMDANQKNKELSEEIKRLRRKESVSCLRDDTFVNVEVSEGYAPSSDKDSNSMMKKRCRDSSHEKELEVVRCGDEREHVPVGESDHALPKETRSPGDSFIIHQPKCCRPRLGSAVNASDPRSCMFQELVECLVDMKFSVVSQTGDVLITAVHETSGYSFNLRWVKSSTGEEELMYHMSSLGTLERIAPEWMRDVIKFSKSMCPVFFERVSGTLKRRN